MARKQKFVYIEAKVTALDRASADENIRDMLRYDVATVLRCREVPEEGGLPLFIYVVEAQRWTKARWDSFLIPTRLLTEAEARQ